MKGSRNSLYWIYIVLLIILFFIYHMKDGPEWISLFEIWFSIKGTSEEGLLMKWEKGKKVGLVEGSLWVEGESREMQVGCGQFL